MNCATVCCNGMSTHAFYYSEDKKCIGLCESCFTIWKEANGGKRVGNPPKINEHALKLMQIKTAISKAINNLDIETLTLGDVSFVLRDLLGYIKTQTHEPSTCKCYDLRWLSTK